MTSTHHGHDQGREHDHQHPKSAGKWQPHTDWRVWAVVLMLVAMRTWKRENPGKPVPLSLAKEFPNWIEPWDALRRRHNLLAPALKEFVGLSFQYADYSMRHGHTESGPPSIVSTVKINQAGFTEMMDTEAMFKKWFAEAKASRLVP